MYNKDEEEGRRTVMQRKMKNYKRKEKKRKEIRNF
jgi:hypothetical protein